MTPPSLSRRSLLQHATLGVAGLAAGPLSAAAPVQRGLAATASTVSPTLVGRALAAIAQHNSRIWSHDVVAIADFSLPSAAPRFHIVNILTGTTTSLRVAHGKGSDPDHSGYLHSFSDVVGSNATSEGAYLTGVAYTGIHGPSRRLIGLDQTNAHAEERAIVIHSAWYADPSMIARQGILGRSDGCFAFGEQDIGQVLSSIGQGRLLYAGRG